MNVHIGLFNGFDLVRTPMGGHITKLPDGTPVFYDKSYSIAYQWCFRNSVLTTVDVMPVGSVDEINEIF